MGSKKPLCQCHDRPAAVTVQCLEGHHDPEMIFYVGHMGLKKDGDVFAPNIQSSVTQAQSRQTKDLPRRLIFVLGH